MNPHGCRRRGLNASELEDTRRAPAALRDRADRAEPGRLYKLDELDALCPGCVPTWSGGWQHDGSCLFRNRPL